MTLLVYLDTSVFSVAVDERSPERRLLTEDFLARARTSCELSSSAIALAEIERTPDSNRRQRMLELFASVPSLPCSDEARALARIYLDDGIFSERQAEDAMHVAIAVCARQDVLASWNFRHLVNRERRARVLAVNAARGYPPIEILSPPEI